ncbi:MAG: hypothetical protein KBS81_08155 [Spirochaetales bacterium]|nr:hypothetical protein [Candidatus Physcosoma equi]
MTNAELNRAMRDAGKSFLCSRLEDLVTKKDLLKEESGIQRLVDAYFKKQTGHHDVSPEETRERILIAKEIIDEERVIDCLEILAETKGLKPEFRMKAKNALKKLSV